MGGLSGADYGLNGPTRKSSPYTRLYAQPMSTWIKWKVDRKKRKKEKEN